MYPTNSIKKEWFNEECIVHSTKYNSLFSDICSNGAVFNGEWTPYITLTIFAGIIIGLLLRIENMIAQKVKSK